jgi:hypothetical protein
MSVAETPPPPLNQQLSVMDVDQQQPDMIPLARLPGSATSRTGQYGGPICEGWLVYFVLAEPARRYKQYWVLSNGVISMYNEYNDGVNPSRVFKQIPLADIIAIQPFEGKAVDSR